MQQEDQTGGAWRPQGPVLDPQQSAALTLGSEEPSQSCWTRVGLGTGLASGGPSCPIETLPQHYHGDVGLEDLFDELVSGGVDQLDDVSMQGVPVLLQEAWAVARSSGSYLESSGSLYLTTLSHSPNPQCLSPEDPQTSLSSTTSTPQQGTQRPGLPKMMERAGDRAGPGATPPSPPPPAPPTCSERRATGLGPGEGRVAFLGEPPSACNASLSLLNERTEAPVK